MEKELLTGIMIVGMVNRMNYDLLSNIIAFFHHFVVTYWTVTNWDVYYLRLGSCKDFFSVELGDENTYYYMVHFMGLYFIYDIYLSIICRAYIYIFHHVIALGGLYLIYYNSSMLGVLYYIQLAELSGLFNTFNNIMAYCKYKRGIYHVNKLLFVFLFLTIRTTIFIEIYKRIPYAKPEYYVSGLFLYFLMIGLHINWYYQMFRKIISYLC